MTNSQKRNYTRATVILVLTAVIALLVTRYFTPAPPDTDIVSLGTSHFTNISAEDITATDDLSVTNDASIGGDMTVTGSTSFGSGTIFNSTTITATTQTITPTTYTAYRLNSAAEITVTLAACSSDGQLLVLYGEDNNTINLVSTNLKSATSSIAQYDTVTYICLSDEWIEIATSTNS